MKYFKELSGDNLYTSWNTRVGAEWDHSLTAHIDILTFMHQLCNLEKGTRITWKTPGSIKHLCEGWLDNCKGSHPYVCRDLCTAFAIAMGVPVDLNAKNAKENLIGLKMSSSNYNNLYYNVMNYGATDLEFAMMTRPDQYQLKLHKQKYGYSL